MSEPATNLDPDIEKNKDEQRKICVESSIRKMLPESLKVTTEFLDELNKTVEQLIVDSVVACKQDKRNTLKGRDVSVAARKKVEQLRDLVENALNGV